MHSTEKPLLSSPGQNGVNLVRHAPHSVADVYSDGRSNNYRLYLPLQHGNVTCFCEGKLVIDGALQPGRMYLLPPGERLISNVHTAMDGVALTIPDRHLRSAVQRTGAKSRRRNPLQFNPVLEPNFQVGQLARTLPHVRTFDPVHGQLFVDGMVDSLLAFLLQKHRRGDERSDEERLTELEFQKATEFAEAAMEKPLRLETWAGVLGMPPSEFERRFRATVGCSPYAWFMDRRIDRAKELLHASDVPLCEVAFSVGFANQSHFTEAFRRRVGISPARWRQERRFEEKGTHHPLWRHRKSD